MRDRQEQKKSFGSAKSSVHETMIAPYLSPPPPLSSPSKGRGKKRREEEEVPKNTVLNLEEKFANTLEDQCGKRSRFENLKQPKKQVA